MKRRRHAVSWAQVTNSRPSKPDAPMKYSFMLGRIILTIDRADIEISPMSGRNCCEEIGELAVKLSELFKEGFEAEKKMAEFSKKNLEVIPFDWTTDTKIEEPLDLNKAKVVPSNFCSFTDKVTGMLPMLKTKETPLFLQSDFWANFFRNLAVQMFELERSIDQGRTPRISVDLFEPYEEPMESSISVLKGQAIKSALFESTAKFRENCLWELYKGALHEINQLLNQIQKLQRRQICTMTRMKSTQRTRSRNANPIESDKMMSNFFSFLERFGNTRTKKR